MMPGQLFEHNTVHTHAKQQDVTCLFSTTIFSNVGSYKKVVSCLKCVLILLSKLVCIRERNLHHSLDVSIYQILSYKM